MILILCAFIGSTIGLVGGAGGALIGGFIGLLVGVYFESKAH